MLDLEDLEPVERPVHPGWASGQTVLAPACLITFQAPGAVPIQWPLGARACFVKTREFVKWRQLVDASWRASIDEYINRQLRSLPLHAAVNNPTRERKYARAGAE